MRPFHTRTKWGSDQVIAHGDKRNKTFFLWCILLKIHELTAQTVSTFWRRMNKPHSFGRWDCIQGFENTFSIIALQSSFLFSLDDLFAFALPSWGRYIHQPAWIYHWDLSSVFKGHEHTRQYIATCFFFWWENFCSLISQVSACFMISSL